MPEFFNVLAPHNALEALRRHLELRLESERVATADSVGRTTAAEITSPENLPAFARSAMDGFSVRASDTFGATEGLPAYFEVVGEVAMGTAPSVSVTSGQAAAAYTGGMLATGADAVVMVEHTQQVDETTIEVVRSVAPGENVLQVAEDIHSGEKVLPNGHVLRPQDVGGLLALGITEIEVSLRPRVSIISTGDELRTPQETPGPGQVRDINTYTVSALVSQAGGIPVPLPLVGDDYGAQRDAAARGLEQADVLVFSAGSSVSSHDKTAAVLDGLGSPGVLVHGISVKPGKPTIVAVVNGKPAFGLPGNPVSAMVVFDLLVRPTLYLLTGCEEPPAPPTVEATLLRDIPSVAGREDYVQVRLSRQNGSLCAEPVFGKSNLIYTLIRADGTVKVPLDAGGIYAGDKVAVRSY